jgi:transcriptional regulator with PAS, ATPase and Fis domain
MNKDHLINAALDDQDLLRTLIPGGTDQVVKVRTQIASFAGNTSARGAILIGPIGSGKSTIARTMALLRYLHFCTDEKRTQIVRNLRFDEPFRIDKKLLDFYEEMNLTGLVPQLAQSQLFGIAKRAASEVSERPGIFERAMTGHQSKGKETVASQVTGGVVFLDEIGDLAAEFQPLLLSLMTGTEVFRVGGEGNPEYGYTFNGVVLTATWKNPFDGTVRPDLLSRLGNYVIQIPGLNERRDEFDNIATELVEEIRVKHVACLDRLNEVRTDVVSRTKLNQKRTARLSLTKNDLDLLRSQDWTKRGDLRGLRQILERSFHDQVSVAVAIEQSRTFENTEPAFTSDAARLFIEELCVGDDQIDLSDELRRIERQTRLRLVETLNSDPVLMTRVTSRTGLSETLLKRKLADLVRVRSRGKE